MNKLNVLAMGLALGILWALGVLFVGLLAIYANYGTEFINSLGTLYLGLNVTLSGVLLGALWAFADAFVGGVVFAWLYNKISS